MKKMNKKGFTLIEILVVIAIIAILVAIIIPTVSNATEKAKEATDVSNIRSLIAQYQIQKLNNETEALNDTAADLVACGAEGGLKSKATCEVTGTGANITHVKFTANILNDGTDATNKHIYEWDLGDILTSST